MNIVVKLRHLLSLVLLGCFFAAPVHAGERATEEMGGTINEINIANGSMIVGGRLYWAGADLKVEINGTYGAFSMLRPGMYINMHYRLKPGPQREVFEVREVMHSREHEES